MMEIKSFEFLEGFEDTRWEISELIEFQTEVTKVAEGFEDAIWESRKFIFIEV